MHASDSKEKSPVLAAVLSLTVAGLGQVYNGQIRKGLLIFLTCWLILPWIFGIVDAYRTASRIRCGQLVVAVPTHKAIMFAGAVFVGFFFLLLMGLILIFFHFLRAPLP